MNIAGYTSSLVVGTKSWQQMNLRHRWLIETLNTDSPLATVSEVAIKNLATFSILDFFTCGPVFPRNPWGLIISPGESTQWAGGHADSCCCASPPPTPHTHPSSSFPPGTPSIQILSSTPIPTHPSLLYTDPNHPIPIPHISISSPTQLIHLLPKVWTRQFLVCHQ